MGPLEEMASKHEVYIVAGANCPVPGEPGKGYCSEVLIGPEGLIGRYNRTIPKGPWIYKGGRFWDFDYQEAGDLPEQDSLPLPRYTRHVWKPSLAMVLVANSSMVISRDQGTPPGSI